ncbi:MAG: dicarboxylate/amino acid:cation symporter [Hydrocarboniphaga sp.]|uniref:dicarboxylate/amino acid:cation symporter n=1 Tax=Hydrocarboniphaga sp. TaxID=2033016 RepID=UPI002636D6D9|nr:dicarboxylate/amino acid:cation symporter [Hydrocarboniphaga sp.]MDB5971753.1 dicarboxylate/amino acid:cation symporter [Hydrocarboniphaga sp.]
MKWPALHWQIAIALVLAVASGWWLGDVPAFLTFCDFAGKMFLNGLKMLVVPLVLSAMIGGIGNLSESSKIGRYGLRTLAFYLGTGTIAILTGLLMVNLLHPGIVDGKPAGPLLGLDADTGKVMESVKGKGAGDMLAVVVRLVPENVFAAAASGDMLGLVTFGFLFGYFVSRLPKELHKTQRDFWQGIYEIMISIAKVVMAFAPIGVLGLVAPIIAKTGWSAFRPLAWFCVAVISALATHMLITLPIVLRVIGRVSPIRHFRAMSPALLTAFSTSSSAASLPSTLGCLETRAGVPRRITGFVLPIGANVNTDGTALYECAAAMFIAQAYGLPLDLPTQFTIVLAALLTSIGVAGIPSASLVAIALILTSIGLPLEGVGLILAVDRVLDMCRTAVNVFGDSCATILVARLEGEDGILGEKALPGRQPLRDASQDEAR